MVGACSKIPHRAYGLFVVGNYRGTDSLLIWTRAIFDLDTNALADKSESLTTSSSNIASLSKLADTGHACSVGEYDSVVNVQPRRLACTSLLVAARREVVFSALGIGQFTRNALPRHLDQPVLA